MPRFHSKLPSPFVDLASGARVVFTEHHADVDDELVDELQAAIAAGDLDELELAAVDATPSTPAPNAPTKKDLAARLAELGVEVPPKANHATLTELVAKAEAEKAAS